MSAELLSRGESQSSIVVVPKVDISPETAKADLKWWEITHDGWMISFILPSGDSIHFWWEIGLINSQDVFLRRATDYCPSLHQ